MWLIGNIEFLCTQYSGIQPHLALRGKSHEFSRFVPGTCSVFSSYGSDIHLKLGFVLQSQDSCFVTTDTSGM